MDSAIDARPLPPHPSLGQLTAEAEALVSGHRRSDPRVLQFIKDRHPGFGRSSPEEIARARFDLGDAYLSVAREHGFDGWPALASHVEALARDGSPISAFESAVDAVVSGDLDTLQQLLGTRPTLARERSTRIHHATLLHYVAANGVENYRQRTPANAVLVAQALLWAGADVDALADTYGGGTAQTTLNLLVSSVHPARAGLQVALVDTLLDFGAAIDGVDGDGSPVLTALAFHCPKAADALARRGAAVPSLIAAAGLGRLDLVMERFDGPLGARPSARWLRFPADLEGQRARALVWASMLGRTQVVKYLLEKGVDPGAHDDRPWTALHWATYHGHLHTARLLITYKAPLERRNEYGGTVLDAAIWCAVHGGADGVDYLPIIDMLIEGGANIDAGWLSEEEAARLDPQLVELLRRGSTP
jgi:hypothetical protein